VPARMSFITLARGEVGPRQRESRAVGQTNPCRLGPASQAVQVGTEGLHGRRLPRFRSRRPMQREGPSVASLRARRTSVKDGIPAPLPRAPACRAEALQQALHGLDTSFAKAAASNHLPKGRLARAPARPGPRSPVGRGSIRLRRLPVTPGYGSMAMDGRSGAPCG